MFLMRIGSDVILQCWGKMIDNLPEGAEHHIEIWDQARGQPKCHATRGKASNTNTKLEAKGHVVY